MKALIVILVIAAAIALWWFKPWEPARYEKSPAGDEARKIDVHVQRAKDWSPPNTWEGRDFIKTRPQAEKFAWQDTAKMIESLYAAGAKNVSFLNIKRRVRTGDQPEGFFVELPEDSSKRAALFSLAAKWPRPPKKDVHQKYIYYGMDAEEWNPDTPEPGFLPD